MSYWNEFYKNFNELEPSPFAKSLKLKGRIVDLGCGNGRDSYYFARDINNTITGIDEAVENKPTINCKFIQSKIADQFIECDVIYARFVFHSIDEETEDYIIGWAKSVNASLCIETRVIGDEPKLYKDHPRRLIDPAKLLNKLINAGFHITMEYGRGLAPYKDEDPLIARFICTR